MLKTVFLVKRSPNMTHDEYVEHYLETHAPLTLDHVEGLEKYVVSFITPDESDPDRPDVVVEMYWTDLDAFVNIRFDSAEGQQLITDDMQLSMGESTPFVVEEYVLKAAPASEPYRPGVPVEALGGRTLPGKGWS
jgi:uncharacterized protein (TIGR02118 family)